MMSADVADALKLLDKAVIRIGAKRKKKAAIPKATSDEIVAKVAIKEDRCVFTNNYDMVVTAVALGARFIWFHDSIENSPTKYDTAKMFFNKWEDWERRLSRPGVECLKVSRKYTSAIRPKSAAKIAARLERRARKAKQAREERRQEIGGQGRLAFDDGED